MALGQYFGTQNNPRVVSDSPPLANVPATEKVLGDEGYGGQPPSYDPEMTGPGGRRMSRIDKPLVKPITGGEMSDSDSGMTVGKQMEMEAGNAIKYRTCSWPKV